MAAAAAVRERTAESALPLAVGDLCAVTKAGAWRYDGEVVVVYSSGHYDVYLQDEKITLTNKPPEEVRRATHNSKEERYDLELAQAKAALGAPSHATARAVRINQSRTCCVMLLVLFLTFASVCAWSFLSAFSLMPQPGKHPSGMCELCVYARYGGRICNLWPEDSPRCHEHFLPWVYGGAFAGVLMCFPLLVLWMGGRPILCSNMALGELSYTFNDVVYPCCDTLGWLRAWWCCGALPTWREQMDYESAERSLKRAKGKPILDRLSMY